ncbi:hypothetical protein PGB90_003982 [Kerria lacca]
MGEIGGARVLWYNHHTIFSQEFLNVEEDLTEDVIMVKKPAVIPFFRSVFSNFFSKSF